MREDAREYLVPEQAVRLVGNVYFEEGVEGMAAQFFFYSRLFADLLEHLEVPRQHPSIDVINYTRKV